jgi:hypothetical protein
MVEAWLYKIILTYRKVDWRQYSGGYFLATYFSLTCGAIFAAVLVG